MSLAVVANCSYYLLQSLLIMVPVLYACLWQQRFMECLPTSLAYH